MESRTTSKLVTFGSPFTLSGLEGIQPPGTYTVRTGEEMLDTLSFAAWRQTGTMVLHRDGGVEYAAIDPRELREALVRDDEQGADAPAASPPEKTSGTAWACGRMRPGAFR